jgi:hypothetical protein
MGIDRQELWVQWTRDATSRYVIPDEIESADDLVDDMIEVATKYADTMLEEFEERFGGGRRRRRKPQEAEAQESED